MQFQSRFESTSMLPPMEPNWIVLNNSKVYSVEPIDLLQIICSLCGMYLVCVCVFECKLSLFQWKMISVDLTMFIRRKCGKILLRFYYENGFGLAELGLIWLGLAWLRCKFYVSIKCTWNLCPSKWYGLVPQPNKAITTQCRFYEHHRQRAIELMKYKLYFGVSLVTITNDILVEIAELNKAFGYSPNTCMKNNHRSRNVQFVYTQYHTACVYVWDAIYCAHWWMMTHGFYFGA